MVRVFIIFIGWIFFAGFAWSQTECEEQAATDLETLFCQIQKTGYGRNLPSFNDFKSNNPKIQAALLRSPARQLGLKVPKPSQTLLPRKENAPASNSNQTAAIPEKAASRNEVSFSLAAATKPAQPVEVSVVARPSLSGCRLQRDSIRCGSSDYRLQLNRANHTLKAGVLGVSNNLTLDYYRGSPRDEAAQKAYLVESYQRYIEAMLRIGLGSSTMSFSKFYYTYDELQQQRQDFVQRFAQMYEFLKRDKSSMAIKASYHNEFPASLEQCSLLDRHIIVCDKGALNWVYLDS